MTSPARSGFHRAGVVPSLGARGGRAVCHVGLLGVVLCAGLVGQGCRNRGERSEDVSLPDAFIAEDAATVDAGPMLSPEDRFARACFRWRHWTDGESIACEDCRNTRCGRYALYAEVRSRECPGEFECVQDTCFPDGTASGIACECVLPCFTEDACREIWIGAMECIAVECSIPCGERLD